MKWNLVNIPVLNPEILDMVDAPQPYIMGMDSSTWREIEYMK